jgi:GT2 family glycosyltransferase
MGIKNAEKNYDYILKLDNDLILQADSLKELIECAESGARIGMVGGKFFIFLIKKDYI